MNINRINTCSFGCTFCDVPGKTARESMNELDEIQRRERKAGYGYGKCPVPGDDYEISSKAKTGKGKITISVVDKNDEVIQSHLDAIAQRNKALISMIK